MQFIHTVPYRQSDRDITKRERNEKYTCTTSVYKLYYWYCSKSILLIWYMSMPIKKKLGKDFETMVRGDDSLGKVTWCHMG